jgi:hypothetical protein
VLKSIANFLSFGESFQFPVFALRFGATAASLVLVFLIGKQFINDGGDKQITLPVAIPAIDTVVPRPTSIKVDLELRDAKVDPSTLITFTTKGLSSDTDNIQKDKNSVYEDSLAITMIAELLDLNDTDYFLTPKKPNMVAAGSSFGKVLRIVDSGNNLITNLFSGDSSSGSITAWILGFPGGPTYQLHSVQLNLDTATVVWTDSLGMSLAVAFTKKSDSAVTRLNSTTVYIKPSK